MVSACRFGRSYAARYYYYYCLYAVGIITYPGNAVTQASTSELGLDGYHTVTVYFYFICLVFFSISDDRNNPFLLVYTDSYFLHGYMVV